MMADFPLLVIPTSPGSPFGLKILHSGVDEGPGALRPRGKGEGGSIKVWILVLILVLGIQSFLSV